VSFFFGTFPLFFRRTNLFVNYYPWSSSFSVEDTNWPFLLSGVQSLRALLRREDPLYGLRASVRPSILPKPKEIRRERFGKPHSPDPLSRRRTMAVRISISSQLRAESRPVSPRRRLLSAIRQDDFKSSKDKSSEPVRGGELQPLSPSGPHFFPGAKITPGTSTAFSERSPLTMWGLFPGPEKETLFSRLLRFFDARCVPSLQLIEAFQPQLPPFFPSCRHPFVISSSQYYAAAGFALQ